MAAADPSVVPWTLRVAAGLVSAEALVEAAFGARLAFGAVASVSIGLLSSSLHAFPSRTLPKA